MLRSTRILGRSRSPPARRPRRGAEPAPRRWRPADGATIDADAFPPFTRAATARSPCAWRGRPACSTPAAVSGNIVEVTGTPTPTDPTLQPSRCPPRSPRASGTGRSSARSLRARRGAQGDRDAGLGRRPGAAPGRPRPRRAAAPCQPRAHPAADRRQQPRADGARARRGVPRGPARALRDPRAQQRRALAPRCSRPGRPRAALRDGHSDIGFNPALVPRRPGDHHRPDAHHVRVRFRSRGRRAAARRARRPHADRRARRGLPPDVPWEAGPAHPDRPRRPRDRDHPRARARRRQRPPHGAGLLRHADGRRPGQRRVVALTAGLELPPRATAGAAARSRPRRMRRGASSTQQVVVVKR